MQGMMHSAQGVQWAVFSVWCVLCNASTVVCNVWWVVQCSGQYMAKWGGRVNWGCIQWEVVCLCISYTAKCNLHVHCAVLCGDWRAGQLGSGRRPRGPTGSPPEPWISSSCLFNPLHLPMSWTPHLVPRFGPCLFYPIPIQGNLHGPGIGEILVSLSFTSCIPLPSPLMCKKNWIWNWNQAC